MRSFIAHEWDSTNTRFQPPTIPAVQTFPTRRTVILEDPERSEGEEGSAVAVAFALRELNLPTMAGCPLPNLGPAIEALSSIAAKVLFAPNSC
jgi:hypothetical protein